MTRSEIFKKAHQNAASWMSRQDKYPSMYSYDSYAECFSECLRSIYRDLREAEDIANFYIRNERSLRAARMMD